MRCDDCAKLKAETNLKTLHDGRTVCNYCPDWARECLAATLLKMPLEARRRLLDEFSTKMSSDAMSRLKETIIGLHTAMRKK
jgi:hypothetical protein